MSNDQGIYVLTCADNTHRVKLAAAIENITQMPNPHIKEAMLVLYFGNSEVHSNAIDAMEQANGILETIDYKPEYGIQRITIKENFPTISMSEAKQRLHIY